MRKGYVFDEAEVSSDTVQTLPPPPPLLYSDRSELTDTETDSATPALQSLYNILYQIYKINGFLSSFIKCDDVKCSNLIDGVTPFH